LSPYGCDPTDTSTCTATPIVEGVLPQNVKVTLEIVNWVPRFVTVSIEKMFWFGIVDWGIALWTHRSIVYGANEALAGASCTAMTRPR
jgi:hypothetical protein